MRFVLGADHAGYETKVDFGARLDGQGHVVDLGTHGPNYTLRDLISAQAIGDDQALTARERRVLRVNLSDDPAAGLAILKEALDA